MGKIEHEFKVERVANALTSEDRLKTLIAKCEAHRQVATMECFRHSFLFFYLKRKKRKGHAFTHQIDADVYCLDDVITPIRHDRKLFNAIRKRAVAARQELIAQREAAGLVKDSQANSETIHLLFPIPAAM